MNSDSDLQGLMKERLNEKGVRLFGKLMELFQELDSDEYDEFIEDYRKGLDNLIYNAQQIKKFMEAKDGSGKT